MRGDVALVHLPMMDEQWYRQKLRNKYPWIEVPENDFVLEGFLESNISKRDVYACYPFVFNDERSPFILHPSCLLMQFVRKTGGAPDLKHFEPANLRGMHDPSIPKDLREVSILNNYPVAHFRTGNAFYDRGMIDDALQEYERGLSYPLLSYPPNSEIRQELLLNRGVVYFKKEMFEKAEAAWKHVLSMNPHHPLAQEYLRLLRKK